MRSIINLDSINKSLSGLTESIKNAQKQSNQISDNVEKRNKVKRDGLAMSSKLFARRRDNMRRREKEDLLEAGGVLGALKASGKVIRRNTKGFLGRILDFVGTIIIGWSILNFPKIIKLAQGVMNRLKKFFGILNKFVDGLRLFFTGLGSRFGEIAELLTRIDFEPFLNQVKNFMKRVNDSFTKITVNTIRTIRKFLGRSEREIAYDIGIGELYDKLKQGQLPTPDGEPKQDGGGDQNQQEGDDEGISGEQYLEELIKQGLEVFKQQTGGEITARQKELLENKEFAKLDEILRTRSGRYEGSVLLQNTRTGEIYYMALNDFLRLNQQLAENGVFPIGEQYDQTIDNPFQNPPLPPGQNTPPPPGSNDYEAGAFSDITPGDIMRERVNDFTGNLEENFEKIKSKLFDFRPPNRRKKEIRIPVEIPNGERLSPIRNSSDTNTSDINNSDLNIKLKDLYRSMRN